MFGIGLAEVFVILVIAVLVIGPKQLPEVAVAVGKFIRSAKQFINEFKRDVYDHPYDSSNTFKAKETPSEQPKQQYSVPEGMAVPELIDDEGDVGAEIAHEEVLEEQKTKPVKKAKKKSATAKKKKKKTTTKKKKQPAEDKQIYLIPDDGPFGKGTDMEGEDDLFTYSRKEGEVN